MDKKIKVIKDGIYILDSDLQQSIKTMNLSPSTVDNWLKGPADAILSKFIEPELLIDEPYYLKRGSWFHAIMENMMRLSVEDRTIDSFIKMIKKVTLEDEQYKEYTVSPKKEEMMEWVKSAYRGLLKISDFNFQNVNVAQIFSGGQLKEGVEIFVRGKIGSAKRNVVGFVDLIYEGQEGIVVIDWKTGKIYPFDPAKQLSETNDFGYWRQQITYTLLLESQDKMIESAALIFPCDPKPRAVWVDVASPKWRQQTIHDFEQADMEIEEAIENDFFFPFKQHRFNKWASYLVGMGRAEKPNIREDLFMEIADVSSVF